MKCFSLWVAGLWCWCATAAAAPVNFVVILVDDLGYGDVPGFATNAVARTPGLDRMARDLAHP